MKTAVALLVLVLVSSSLAATDWDRALQRYVGMLAMEINHADNNVGSTWKNCGKANDPIQLKKFSISPDPIAVPGNITLGAAGHVASALTSPLKATVDFQALRNGHWIKLPCIHKVGSCVYDDVCKILPPGPCPAGVKVCHCPFPAGLVALQNIKIPLAPVGLKMKQTQVRMKAVLSHNGVEMGCYELDTDLVVNS
ncbi:ganglioside GM2 activator [Lingula anatina]|uniref:Ganglioside GM2 activator n=1 Tax=Lingula anatina TaxID=7574 RepID=A0A1S3KBQ0_LINAN|nr:ganglioside GM2 activator [Lingula anatina]|eukprot:XP_013419869.1 ganglioside GM2 activator [Lingula anatina]